jgi:ADP-ribose pyrophosphatase YjhB (NUDIX family)
MTRGLSSLLDELRIIAQNGLRYSDNQHDERRYERILELVAEHYGETLSVPPEEMQDRLAAEIGHITPKVGAGAAIFDEDGKILLMKRPDRGDWNVPGGFVDPNEGPEGAVVREVKEETNLDIRIVELVGAYHQPATAQHANEVVGLVYLCERTGGELRDSEESTALQYWQVESVPEWHRRARRFAIDAYDAWQEYRATSS